MRHAVIEKLPLLAKQLGPEFFERELLPRTLDWLRDPVATIRDSAMEVRGLGCCVWFFFWVSCCFWESSCLVCYIYVQSTSGTTE